MSQNEEEKDIWYYWKGERNVDIFLYLDNRIKTLEKRIKELEERDAIKEVSDAIKKGDSNFFSILHNH